MVSLSKLLLNGRKPDATWAQLLVRALAERTPLAGNNSGLRRSSIGFSYSAGRTSVAGSGGPYPFDITVDTTDGVKASFYPGTGQQRVPDNILMPIAVPAETLSYALLRLATDGKAVQTCTLMIDTQQPPPLAPVKNALPMQVDVMLHLINYVPPTGTATQGTYQTFRLFNPATDVRLTSIEAFRTSADAPQPGGLPYDIYYTWAITGT